MIGKLDSLPKLGSIRPPESCFLGKLSHVPISQSVGILNAEKVNRENLISRRSSIADSPQFLGESNCCHSVRSLIDSLQKAPQLPSLAGVERDSHGQLRTIYSLRHTYATFRRHEGVHQFILARNMGTSVAMLEQYYGHTGNVTSAVELTKTAKKRQTGGKSSGLNWLK